MLLLLLLFVTGGGAGCTKPHRVETALFLVQPWLRGGGERPTTPTNLNWSYSYLLSLLTLEWQPSVDKETGSALLYRIYLYENGPPQEYFRPQDILTETAEPILRLGAEPFSHTLYFVVTSWDGLAESLPSPLLKVDLSQKDHIQEPIAIP